MPALCLPRYLVLRTFFAFLALQLFLGLASLAPPIRAQGEWIEEGETGSTNPKERQTTVLATVPDFQPPSTPLLIAPGDQSTLTSSPSFVWKESSDNVGVTQYSLSLNGSVLFESIPTTTHSTEDFTLEYSSSKGEYTLIPKRRIPDGIHTWKVTSYDARNNTAHSATWSFTLDTTAPAFVITLIESAPVSISAQDTSTIPTEPQVLEENEPRLSGTGEDNSSVLLSIVWGSTLVAQEFTIDSAGSWNTTLPLLPRDTLITLAFQITDEAGNLSVLEGVQLILPKEKAVIPKPGDHPIEIPITPPNEAVRSALETATQHIARLVPRSAVQYTQELTLRASAHLSLWNIGAAHLTGLAALLILPGFATTLLVAPFQSHISLHLVWNALLALVWLPEKHPGGIVFDSETYAPVQYAAVILSGTTRSGKSVHKVRFTNRHGLFTRFSAPPGDYRVTVERRHMVFPSLGKRPSHESTANYYQGEAFSRAANEPEIGLLIPAERIQEDSRYDQVAQWFATTAQYRGWTAILAWIGVAFLALLSPTIGNTTTLALFGGALILRQLAEQRATLTGIVVTQAGTPVHHAIVKCEHASGALYAVTQSNGAGRFRLPIHATRLHLSVHVRGLQWSPSEAQKYSTLEPNPLPEHIILVLERAPEKAVAA